MTFPLQLIVVDDDEGQCCTLADILTLQGYNVDTAQSVTEAFALFERQSYELAIVDIRLGDISGPDLVKKISDRYPVTEFIYMTGFASLETAMMAVRQKRVIELIPRLTKFRLRSTKFCSIASRPCRLSRN